MSWQGVITNAGQTILNQLSGEGHTLTIDGVTVGSGYVSDANMRAATALSSEKDEAEIVKVEYTSSSVKINILIGPTSETEYTCHEIGIWAHLDSESPVLFALHQDSAGGVGIPTQSASPDFGFSIFAVHAISNTESLTVTISPNAYVLQSTLDNEVAALESADFEAESAIEDIWDVFAGTETSPTTSSHNYGAFIVYNNKLYQVNASMPVGTTLVEGNNITSAKVGGKIKVLEDNVAVLNYKTQVVSTSAAGLAPALEGGTTKYLRADGKWKIPPDTNTTYAVVTTSAAGLAPALAGGTTKYLRADGTWQVPPDTNTTYSVVSTSAAGLCPTRPGGTTRYLRADGTWQVPPDTNTTYSVVSTSAAGLAPVRPGGTTKFLRADGTWAVPPDTNTTYSVVSTSAAGLAPKRTGTTTKFLRDDGTWAVPPNTTYSNCTASSFGLVKLSDTYASKVSSGAAANALGSSQNALYNAYNTNQKQVLFFSLGVASASRAVGAFEVDMGAFPTRSGYERVIVDVRAGSSYIIVHNRAINSSNHVVLYCRNTNSSAVTSGFSCICMYIKASLEV